MHRVLPFRLTALLAVSGLLLVGCAVEEDVDDDIAEPEPTGMLEDPDPLEDQPDGGVTSPSPGTGESPGEQPPVVGTIDVPDLDARCSLEPSTPQVERITYSVPSSWQVDGSCQVLDPELDELPQDTESDAAVLVTTAAAGYGEASSPGTAITDVTTWLGARAGYQALRRDATSTGEAAIPEGQPILTWMVDLDVGVDEDGGILTLTTTSEDDRVRALVDAIAETVVIQPPADRQAENTAPESLAVVRTEGGGTPFSVTYDGDCFALRPDGAEGERTDQECDLDPTEAPIVARVLGDDVLVGYAPATSIGVQSDELDPPYGLAANIEGGTVFAFPVSELPTELTAIGKGGEELVTEPVG